jgi:cobalt/nickel transport system permease protein
MSHIHIPDGVLPWWLWVTGWAATALLLAVASRMATRAGSRRAVPLVGAISALVLVAMSTEIVPIAYHVNLTVIAGALLGPGSARSPPSSWCSCSHWWGMGGSPWWG